MIESKNILAIPKEGDSRGGVNEGWLLTAD